MLIFIIIIYQYMLHAGVLINVVAIFIIIMFMIILHSYLDAPAAADLFL